VSSGQLGPANTTAACYVGANANGEQPTCKQAVLHWRFCFGWPGAAGEVYATGAAKSVSGWGGREAGPAEVWKAG
jgi:hypothetical protein